MRYLLAVVVWAGTCGAQVKGTFAPQPDTIPGLTEYLVVVCNRAEKAVTVEGLEVYRAAAQKVNPVTRTTVGREAAAAAKKSPWRWVPTVLEFTSAGVAAAQAGKKLKIKELPGWVAPAVTVGLPAVITLLRKEAPVFEAPENLVPPFLNLAPGPGAGACAQFSLFASGAPVGTFELQILP
jgi:hypothetical protein